MKKFQIAILLLFISTISFAQTFKFNNEPGTPMFFVTGDSILFHSAQQDLCGPEYACQGDLVTSPNPACPGQWVTVTANPTQGSWPYTFLWSNGATTQQQTLQFFTQTDLWVQVTDGSGCSWFAQATIFMNNGGINPTISGNPQFCSGASTTLTASGTGTFSWTGPNGFSANGASITVNQPGTYTVTVNNGGCSGSASVNVAMNPAPVVSIAGPAGFCPNSNATLTASSNVPGSSFSWSTGQFGASLTTFVGGTYTVTATAPGGCASSATKTITAFPAPSAVIKVTRANDVTTLSVSAPIALWSTGANTPTINNAPNGIYAVTVTDANGCVATNPGVEVNMSACAPPCPAPVANFTFAPHPQNAQVIVFTNTTNTSGLPTTYAWNFGDGTSSMEQNPTHFFQPGNWNVTLTATNGCPATSQVTHIVVVACPPPVANFNFSTNGATASFSSTSTGNGLTYLWDFGDGGSSTLQNPSHTYGANGTYSVTLKVTNVCGATHTTQKFVTVFFCGPLDAQFNLPISGGLSNLQFTNTSTGTGLTYLWTFGDGGTSTDEDPVHTYAQSGVYNVKLKAFDACGNVDQINKLLTVLNVAPSSDDRYDEFKVYPTLTPSQFWLEGAPGMYILTDPQGRSKKLIKTE